MKRRIASAAIALLACWPAAFAGITPEGEATQIHSAKPGDTYRGAIAIRNPGSEVVQVKLYQSDYLFFADGQNRFDRPGSSTRSNAGWLRLNREQIDIAPGGVATVDYEVQVPPDSRLTGTYWSVVMVQELPAGEAAGATRPGMKLTQTLRHAIQIITEMGESGRSEIAFRNARLVGEGAERGLDIDLENTGERWLRTDVWLELHDTNGRVVGRFVAPRRRSFPGTSVRNRIELGSAPAGKYLGLLVADGGRNDLFGMQVELDLR
ncbi:MAG TPA: hypothetical protein VIV63_10400 [Steroidobacteraceae bacterium]